MARQHRARGLGLGRLGGGSLLAFGLGGLLFDRHAAGRAGGLGCAARLAEVVDPLLALPRGLGLAELAVLVGRQLGDCSITPDDVLYGVERQDCGTTTASLESTVRAYYESVIRTTSNPAGWPSTNIEVVSPVKFWDGQSTYQATCYDDLGINLQLITLRVRNADGKIVETVEIVKG